MPIQTVNNKDSKWRKREVSFCGFGGYVGPPWRLMNFQNFDRFDLITRRFNHQNDIIYRNVAPNICLQFGQICSTFTGNSVPLFETIFMECTNVLSFQTDNRAS